MKNAPSREEVLIAFAGTVAQVPACSRVRSTLVTSSIKAIRDEGLFARYREQLPDSVLDELLYVPAGVWIPVALASRHYAACSQLGLPPEESARLGGVVADLTQKTVLSVIARLAREGGVTPWTLLEQMPKFWGRLFEGSAVSVTKLGPKEARIETAGNSLQQYPHFRNSFRGLMRAMAAPFCTAAYMRETPPARPENHHTVHRASWA